MSAKGKLLDLFTFRNILILLIAVLIIAAAIIVITDESDETVDVLTVKEVVANSGIYIESGENITIQAYYDTWVKEGLIEITDSQGLAGTVPGAGGLLVDHSGMDNVSIVEGNQYLFTGVLKKYELNTALPILIAYKIERK